MAWFTFKKRENPAWRQAQTHIERLERWLAESGAPALGITSAGEAAVADDQLSSLYHGWTPSMPLNDPLEQSHSRLSMSRMPPDDMLGGEEKPSLVIAAENFFRQARHYVTMKIERAPKARISEQRQALHSGHKLLIEWIGRLSGDMREASGRLKRNIDAGLKLALSDTPLTLANAGADLRDETPYGSSHTADRFKQPAVKESAIPIYLNHRWEERMDSRYDGPRYPERLAPELEDALREKRDRLIERMVKDANNGFRGSETAEAIRDGIAELLQNAGVLDAKELAQMEQNDIAWGIRKAQDYARRSPVQQLT